jgi:hypothetical protein
MYKQLKNSKGVSLPIVIGLVSLLMIASVAANELIMRALRSAQQIEASDKAYFAAEAGVEDALYELSEHFAGYETPNLTNANVRTVDFSGDVRWVGNWEIKNRDADNEFEGKFYPKRKLVISLFQDNTPGTISDNAINENPDPPGIVINKIDASATFNITFRIPYDADNDGDGVMNNYTGALAGDLTIDNDDDNSINEDGKGDTAVCAGISLYEGEDADCDGREDEDSDRDPVIFWELIDGEGNSFSPVSGCLGGIVDDPNDPEGTEMCEKDFQLDANGYISVSIDASTEGMLNGEITPGTPTISAFIGNAPNNAKLQIEFLIVAPLKKAFGPEGDVRKVDIPYLEYIATAANALGNATLPQFTIRSDGWYQDFKQSITTTVTPKTTAPLFDFTIIQQQK